MQQGVAIVPTSLYAVSDGYAEFLKSNEERTKSREESLQAELKQVKFRRLVQQLENVILARNISLIASPEVLERYRKVVSAEEGLLGN